MATNGYTRGTVAEAPPGAPRAEYRPEMGVERMTTYAPTRDRVRWGPILAGLVAILAALVFLTVLGLAIGTSVFEPTSDGGNVGTAAAIYAAVAALLSFLFGGWVAGRSAAVNKDQNALLNGFLVGAAAVVFLLWLSTTGTANLLGGIGVDLNDIAQVGRNQLIGGAGDTGQAVRDQAIAAYDNARDGAWGTVFGLIIALASSTLGAWIGHRQKQTEDTVTVRD